MKQIAVLISGRGSNLKAILQAQTGVLAGIAQVAVVISNSPDALGLAYARQANIDTLVVDQKAYPDRVAYDHALLNALALYELDLIALAGFMRILSPVITVPYANKIINIHPSLLPKHPGLHTHEAALAAGDKHHGATVHFVDNTLDAGPRIAQAEVTILPNDTPADLADRVLEKEHLLYPKVIRWFCEERLTVSGNAALLDGKPIHFPLDPDPEPEPFERMEEDF